MQKDRFFELLNAKYWNASKLSMCPNADESEGITLESLGKIKYYKIINMLKIKFEGLELGFFEWLNVENLEMKFIEFQGRIILRE